MRIKIKPNITGGIVKELFAMDLRTEGNRMTITVPSGDTFTVSSNEVEIIDEQYTESDFEKDYRKHTKIGSENAPYLCECGCPCLGENPCSFGCGGSVTLTYKQRQAGVIPRK